MMITKSSALRLFALPAAVELAPSSTGIRAASCHVRAVGCKSSEPEHFGRGATQGNQPLAHRSRWTMADKLFKRTRPSESPPAQEYHKWGAQENQDVEP